jgi:hypothetical protein
MAALRPATARRLFAVGHGTWRSPRRPLTSFQRRLAHSETASDKRLSQFDVSGKVFVVTGGGRGLGLCMAEGLVEAGGMGE